MNRRERRALAKAKGDPDRMFERQISKQGGVGRLSERVSSIRAAQELADAADEHPSVDVEGDQ